ncbi:MAG: hypothetical protein SGJ19_16030 [Planctomycetia bacterium]|nr:hypothetical protein [Planctomycetia bacterium]
MDDFTILGIKNHFLASEEQDYRQRVIDGYVTFANFLQDNGLLVHEVLRPGEAVTIESRIMKSDLTDEGFELVKRALDRWLRARDRSQNPKNTGILVRELKKMRGGD